MPVYLSQPGDGHRDPWRYGVQVFPAPCQLDSNTPPPTGSGEHNLLVASWTPKEQQEHSNNSTERPAQAAGRGTRPVGVRRIRHAELVLVDDVCVAYDRYWLRLRWPGNKGGFAGYIAMGPASDSEKSAVAVNPPHGSPDFQSEDRAVLDEGDLDDPNREETASMSPSEPGESFLASLRCTRTGLTFPSSNAMRLLSLYDDGISPPVALAPLPTESVFCRICREGLHDDADDELPAAERDADTESRLAASGDEGILDGGTSSENLEDLDLDEHMKGPVQPHPTYSVNTDALQNPMLAPCECSGSMAFVHYLCVEQWRCRSRHPDAHNGLNCETCGSAYALPPPAEREVNLPQIDQDQDDWLEAMPPHVMQALRQPHIWWQIGAAIVRRRWLRPIAPVLMSPVVALYCRARRLLKKRGVARRRWACSLCRRRARWKCVRCLRSYYCSRQCQNVSWHIIHKHVCYKPARFWWSFIVYSAFVLAVFPGVLSDPLMYDVGLFSVPVSFVITGILAGSAATLAKKATGIDARGRMLELLVVLSTCTLTFLTWGLIQGFFGDAGACYGALGAYDITAEELEATPSMVKAFQAMVLRPARIVYLSLDDFFLNYTGSWVRAALCGGKHGCFEHLPLADENFFLQEQDGQKCASDLIFLLTLYVIALVSYAVSAFAKHQERRQRRERAERRQMRPLLIRRPQQQQNLHLD